MCRDPALHPACTAAGNKLSPPLRLARIGLSNHSETSVSRVQVFGDDADAADADLPKEPVSKSRVYKSSLSVSLYIPLDDR